MKTFGEFINEDGGMGAGAVGGGSGAAPTNTTVGVAGAGDNPQKIVPVSKKNQRKYVLRGMRSASFGPGFK